MPMMPFIMQSMGSQFASRTGTRALVIASLALALPASHAPGQELTMTAGRVPDEYESSGGHSLAFSNGGSAAVAGQGSVKNNPAMLALEKQYTLSAGYHWPSIGREYFQAGAVDSKTSPLAAGFTYTSSREKLATQGDTETAPPLPPLVDSPINYRASLGLAQAFSHLAAGAGAQYVEGIVENEQGVAVKQKGATLGLGLAGLLSPSLRFGASAENMANSRVQALAPQVYRLGLAYTLFNGDVTAHLDYSQRQRVAQEVSLRPALASVMTTRLRELSQEQQDFYKTPEHMVIASFSARIQDLIRVLGSYGHELKSGQRRMLSGGLALVNQNFSFSYLVSQPYLAEASIHHAVNFSLQVSL